MIRISPQTDYTWKCPYCLTQMPHGEIVWQGIHVGVSAQCKSCGETLMSDLPIGHANYDRYIVDRNNGRVFGPNTYSKTFFGLPFLHTLQYPDQQPVSLKILRKKKNIREAIIVNCLDYLYGHCLLKLFNVQRHLQHSEIPVIVIVPDFLVWLVPKGVAEIWSVPLTLSQMKSFYPDLHHKIHKEISRFSSLYLSKAYSHPNQIDIHQFTGINTHNWESKKFRATFIWREDRPWFFSFLITYAFKKLHLMWLLLWWQNIQVRMLLWMIKQKIPQAELTVAGIGTSTSFPQWIEDHRVQKPSILDEKKLCQVYSESRVIIGVHGSSMLLPSTHAGAVIDLLPSDRLGNFAQDVMYHSISEQRDPRIISFLYRYVPISTSPNQVASQATSIIQFYHSMRKYFHTTLS